MAVLDRPRFLQPSFWDRYYSVRYPTATPVTGSTTLEQAGQVPATQQKAKSKFCGTLRKKKHKRQPCSADSPASNDWGDSTLVGQSESSPSVPSFSECRNLPLSSLHVKLSTKIKNVPFSAWLRSNRKHPVPREPIPQIKPGRECMAINGQRCWHIDYKSYPEAERVAKHVSYQVNYFIHGPGGVSAGFQVETFLIGPNLKDVTPTVVVSCNSITTRRYLEKNLLNLHIPKESWVEIEISNDFPYKIVPTHLSGTPDAEPVAKQASAPPNFRTVPLNTFITPPSCIDEHSWWDVYLRDAPENGQITFPATFYVGTERRLLHKITIGGLIVLEGDEALYGVTVGHAVALKRSVDDPAKEHVCSTPNMDANTKLRCTTGDKTAVSGEASKFTAVGTVVNSTRQLTSELDWALVRFFKEFQVVDRSFYNAPTVSSNIFDFSNYQAKRDRRVRALCATGGVSGWLRPYISYISAAGDEYLTKTLPVEIDGEEPLEPGDCGSWVVDTTTNNIGGFVSYGGDDSNVIFIIPAWDIFCEIQNVTHRLISIVPYNEIANKPQSLSSSCSSSLCEDEDSVDSSTNSLLDNDTDTDGDS